MRRIVLDTNCLLQALPSRSPYHKIWTEVMAGHISLCVNSDILSEYEEKLAEKTTPEIARNVLEAITRLHTTVFQQVYFHLVTWTGAWVYPDACPRDYFPHPFPFQNKRSMTCPPDRHTTSVLRQKWGETKFYHIFNVINRRSLLDFS